MRTAASLCIAACCVTAGCKPAPKAISPADLEQLRNEILREVSGTTDAKIREALEQQASGQRAAKRQQTTIDENAARAEAERQQLETERAEAHKLKLEWARMSDDEHAFVERVKAKLAEGGIEALSDVDRDQIMLGQGLNFIADDLRAAMKIPRRDQLFRKRDDFADAFDLSEDDRLQLMFFTSLMEVEEYIRYGKKLINNERLNTAEIKTIRAEYPLLEKALAKHRSKNRG